MLRPTAARCRSRPCTPPRGSLGLSRRRFLQAGGATAAAFLAPRWLRIARGALTRTGTGTSPVLVAIYLRGGADGLNLVVPADDPDYYTLRPDIQVAPGDEIPLDGFFGLNPALADLMPLYADEHLAIVHAAGSPDGSRSHFDAQDFMEQAAPGAPFVSDGWLNRMLGVAGASDSWAGISFGSGTAVALQGASPSLAMRSLAGSGLIAAVPPHTGTGTRYANTPCGDALRDTAALIRADIGVRAVNIDLGGWDHHEGETAALSGVASALAAGLAAFRADLAEHWHRTVVVVMTEFGRSAAQNGSAGTDHGHGSVMIAAGGAIAGGRVITKNGWPGLAQAKLFEGRDLAVTSDFRDVFAELLNVHMELPIAALGEVLPGHSVQPANFPGLFF